MTTHLGWNAEIGFRGRHDDIEISDEESHFALNIPYYTHFKSPIRRDAGVIVHHLLFQATLDGEEAVEDFPLQAREIHPIRSQCNEKKEASRKAQQQERSSVVFASCLVFAAHTTQVSTWGCSSFPVGMESIYSIRAPSSWNARQRITMNDGRR
jgi:hypothetical protein